MKKNKNEAKRLALSKETLAILDPASLSGIAAAAVKCQESVIVCSIIHTCWSCVASEDTCA
jgi:hypothetical protein